ncbi:hypothetical protein C2869_06720 [Saccharobesus litoralis]|uniref:Uncharacterized protein n=1 Tax=Saccharobesus litoralis TaxID=2172099 RepID=A0A2S0VPM4_9ALTE|nr:transporter substrate-binding domain-containing protein [Saccharobesus litoralis]AWB66149.1 hypothetical protein C2869_06720 [Saccharobesus litoralis]
MQSAIASTYADANDYEIKFLTIASDEQTRRLMLSNQFNDITDLTYAVTRPHWEAQLLTVRVPLLKGLMGYRVFFIHKDTQDYFTKIDNLKRLKLIRLGSGRGWSFSNLYQQQHFKVVLGEDTSALIKMLNKGRLDYFPRGIVEVKEELARFKPHYANLTIEESLVTYTPMPVYFFINPNNPELAKRLRRGLQNIIDNGEYEQKFAQYFAKSIKQLNVKQRRLLTIPNTTLTTESRQNLASFWATQPVTTSF